jgi:ubiquinone/menaquinone biosynthesis C-methylase UbiE
MSEIYFKLSMPRARQILSDVQEFIDKDDKLLDFGAGTCNICEILYKDGYDITPVDIEDLNFSSCVSPTLYDGETLPFSDNEFDKTLVLTVLHHIPEHKDILREIMRVSKRLIIMEDVYKNSVQKHATYFLDSLLGMEFEGHPHTNRTDREWRNLFNQLGLKIIDEKFSRSHLVFTHATYYLDKI